MTLTESKSDDAMTGAYNRTVHYERRKQHDEACRAADLPEGLRVSIQIQCHHPGGAEGFICHGVPTK